MISFLDRENSLRDFFHKKIASGESLLSIAKDIGIAESTLRNFLGKVKKNEEVSNQPIKSLSAKKYNLIVSFYKDLNMDLNLLDFSLLVRLLENVNKDSIRWDFLTDFETSEVDLFSQFKSFVTEDTRLWEKKCSLLDLINPAPGDDGIPIDPFIKVKKLSKAKDNFEKQYKNKKLKLNIWGAPYYDFLARGNNKEIFIFTNSCFRK